MYTMILMIHMDMIQRDELYNYNYTEYVSMYDTYCTYVCMI